MTIRLLATYRQFKPNTIVTLATATENALVAGGNATTDLSGGVPFDHQTPANSRQNGVAYGTDGVPIGISDSAGNILFPFTGITPPGAPTGLTLTAIAGGVIAAFTAPASNGGTVITGYEVTLSTGQKQLGATTTVAVNSPAGVAVTATVKAITGAALAGGPASAVSNSATPTSVNPPTPATALTLTGPTSGTVGTATSAYTVALSPNGGTVASPVTVTPTAVSGVTFSPTSLTLTTAQPSGTFTANASTAGTKSIAVTNNGGLTNPTAISLVVAAAQTAALRVVSDRLYINQNRSASAKQMGGSRKVKLGTGGNAVALRFANWFVDGFGNTANGTPTYTELGSGGAAVFTAAVEYPTGTFYQGMVSGSPNGNVADGAEVVLTATLPTFPDNTEVTIHSYQNQTGGGFVVHGGSGGSAGAPTVTSTTAKDVLRSGASGVSDATMTGNWAGAGGTDATGNAMGPISVSVLTTKPSVLILGTSIDHGEGGTQATVFNSGLICPQLSAAGIGFINAGVRADSVRKSNAADAKRVALGNSSEITTVIFGGPVNDVTSATPTRTAAEIFADIQTEWAKYPSKNRIQLTMTPLTSDTAGTTPIARAQVWRDVNDLIRNNTNGVKVWDIAAVMSNGGATTCTWVSGDTADGTHPTNQGYTRVRSSNVVNIADIV